MATFLTGIKDTWNILPNETENIICEISLRLIIYSFYICVWYKCVLWIKRHEKYVAKYEIKSSGYDTSYSTIGFNIYLLKKHQ